MAHARAYQALDSCAFVSLATQAVSAMFKSTTATRRRAKTEAFAYSTRTATLARAACNTPELIARTKSIFARVIRALTAQTAL